MPIRTTVHNVFLILNCIQVNTVYTSFVTCITSILHTDSNVFTFQSMKFQIRQLHFFCYCCYYIHWRLDGEIKFNFFKWPSFVCNTKFNIFCKFCILLIVYFLIYMHMYCVCIFIHTYVFVCVFYI